MQLDQLLHRPTKENRALLMKKIVWFFVVWQRAKYKVVTNFCYLLVATFSLRVYQTFSNAN
ncbi:hypothetical protein [Paenibacillus sp. FJAT-26967]|uniref:hypothetical protein n=1 Tax=Paenibacillus sp. FJAT-26967 TaxID=1729690 RepID=UPI0008399AC0|nr:hypothetical protein [Paenibacillus sp. FJAT-26967]